MLNIRQHFRFAGLVFSTLLLFVGCRGPERRAPVNLSDLEKRPLYTFTEDELDAYLPSRHAACPQLTRRVVALGRQDIGQPYEIFLLGEFPFEEYDSDPIYNLARGDCLTFSEHMYAMALSRDWPTFLRTLQRLRYRDGQIGMVTRNHYTEADWDRNNAFLFEDITAKLGGGRAALPMRQVCRRAKFFAQFGIGQDVPDETIEDCYIPKERLPEVLSELRDADFVNIMRGTPDAPYCGHTGLIAIGADGQADFLHSARPAVREQPLLDFVEKDKRCIGVKFLRLRPDAEKLMKAALADSPRATDVSERALTAALRQRRAAAPDDAKPLDLDWKHAMHLQAYRLEFDTPVDDALQDAVAAIDKKIGDEMGIPEGERAVGVFDLREQRLAMVNPDLMFYGASVPKIVILAAYLETHPEMVEQMPADVALELGKMIKLSDNELASKYAQLVTLDKLQEFIHSPKHLFYDEQHGGGLWIGKFYGVDSPRIGDPLHDHSHGATVRQCLRYYLWMEQGNLVSAAASRKMREIFASPSLAHTDHNFYLGLKDRGVSMIRKSGTWEDWHLDTARVEDGEHAYLLVGMTHHPRGQEFLAAFAREMCDWFRGEKK